MHCIYKGKTKDVFMQDNGQYMLVFKNDMTGSDGDFDPGSNTVGLSVDGAGVAGLEMSAYYFKLLEEKGYPTHFVSAKDNTMTVKPAAVFGRGLEVICRYKALGSFFRRYGDYISEGTVLDALVEMTLKDDKRGDPPASEDTLLAIGVLKRGEYAELRTLAKNICGVIKDDLREKGLELCDIKLEFGKDADGKLMLIDEISGGNMRVTDNGDYIYPLELSKRVIRSEP
ncbi:MAG: phosphoribosylaminoimidazolesuccinocarboxamide synthase [Oscillospiraceae bacterium]|nr:phosphoribosylaminoimidazolesuccinocarboxamide synthase [Oscillospiraceae bacterium]